MTHYLFGESEYRDLVPIEKALKLISDKNISIRKAAIACNLSSSAVARGVKARKENRNIGDIGHPKNLNKEQEKELISCINDKLNEGEKLTYKDINNLVNLSD